MDGPINSLDAVQLEAIEAIVADRGSNHLVKDFAGTGKAIVLTHVLERLAAKRNSGSLCFANLTHALKDMVVSGLSAAALRIIDSSLYRLFEATVKWSRTNR